MVEFGAKGAVKTGGEAKVKELLVIPKQKNRDWRAEARFQHSRNLLPLEVQAAREAARMEREGRGENGGVEGVDVVNSRDGEVEWGLSVRKRESVREGGEVEVEVVKEAERITGSEVTVEGNGNVEPPQKKTADEEALDALLGKSEKPKGPDLIIPTAPQTQPQSEESAYRAAIASAPDVSTLEDYERVPVEEFGAALLRGMGWKGEKNKSDGVRGKEVKRRQNLLGLGAKELDGAEELGAWVRTGDVKRLKGPGEKKFEKRPKASEYLREKEERRVRREERGGGGYRDRERERDDYRERERGGRDRYGDRERERDRRR